MDLFEEIIQIVHHVRESLGEHTNLDWSKYKDVNELIFELETVISALQVKEYIVLEQVKHMFAPTGSLQEISISNGWGSEFLELAERVDKFVGLS